MQLKKLTEDYYSSYDFNNLREETKAHYKYLITSMLSTKVEGKTLGVRKCTKISSRMAKFAYNQWCERGIHTANHILSYSRIVFNYAIHMELCISNPFTSVKKRTTNSRKTVWTKEQVKLFLDEAYSKFKTRNLGLIAQMAYEWCQRLGDMRLLTWSSIDFEKKMVYIRQSKRRAEVFLPISDELLEMLQQQHEDFGFQEYIAPSTRPQNRKYPPYTLTNLPRMARRVMDKANLPKDLRLSDLRRTGTTEMVEAGVSMGNIMAVTGHSNPQSVKPYMKNTFTSANLALKARKDLTEHKIHDINTLTAEQEKCI